MNKARITYRLDPNRLREEEEGGQRRHEEAPRVIPLYQEEYRVEEEPRHREPAAREEPRREGRRPEEPSREDARWDEPERERERDESSRYQHQQPPIRDYQPLNSYTTDYGAWNSPYDAETQEIENLIRASNEREGRRPLGEDPYRYERSERLPREADDRRVRRPQEPYPEPRYSGNTGYYQPPGNGNGYREEYEGPIVTGHRYVRHSRPPWLKISAAVAGAAVTGVLLGFFALSLFNGTGASKSSGAVNAADQPAQPVSAVVQESAAGTGAVSGTGVKSGKEVAMAYTGKTYSILQHGIFGGQQAADQVKNDLIKKGLAAATEQGDKFYVYAGVAGDKETATAMGRLLKDGSQLEIYVKPYAIPTVSKVYWNGSADKLKTYLEQSDKLLQSMTSLAALQLDSGGSDSLDAATLQSIGTAHAAWSQVAGTVSQEAGEANKALVQRMNNAMNSAKTSLDEYKKKPSAAMLWQTQTYAMQFVIAEKELLTRIQ